MSVGVVLSEARIRAGLSLEEIAARTCIRRTLVENIESDDFHACGGDFYARGHVKSIAQAVHIDPAPLLAEFDHDHSEDDAPTASGVLDVDHVAVAGRGADGRQPNWTAAMAVVLAGLVAFGAFHYVTVGRGSSSDTAASIVLVPSSAAGAQPPSGSQPSGPVASSSAIAAVPTRGVTVVLSGVGGRSWVSATGKDAGVLYQSVMATGQEQTVRDNRQVNLVVGNAGAVHLLVNGRDLGAPGGQGQVVHLTFGPGDPTLAGG